MRSRAGLIATLLAVLTGCSYGYIYQDTTEPFTTNVQGASTRGERASGDSTLVTLPFARSGGLRAEWASYGIGDAARRAGLCSIDYADIRKRRVLGGIWERTEVLVYGRRCS